MTAPLSEFAEPSAHYPKLRILAEADEPGARIGDVARRHDIHPGQIRLWRQSFSYVDRPAMFLPVEITEEGWA
ncbi:transposase [Rhizobium beringeri]